MPDNLTVFNRYFCEVTLELFYYGMADDFRWQPRLPFRFYLFHARTKPRAKTTRESFFRRSRRISPERARDLGQSECIPNAFCCRRPSVRNDCVTRVAFAAATTSRAFREPPRPGSDVSRFRAMRYVIPPRAHVRPSAPARPDRPSSRIPPRLPRSCRVDLGRGSRPTVRPPAPGGERNETPVDRRRGTGRAETEFADSADSSLV